MHMQGCTYIHAQACTCTETQTCTPIHTNSNTNMHIHTQNTCVHTPNLILHHSRIMLELCSLTMEEHVAQYTMLVDQLEAISDCGCYSDNLTSGYSF